MWSNFSDEDSRSSRCVLCENEAPWGGTGVSAAILYWIGICKIIQTFSGVAVANLAYLPFRKAWLVPEELQIEVSSRCHQGIISNINWSNWLFFGNVIRPPASGLKAFAVVETSAKGVSICLVSRWRLGDGKRCFRGSFLDSNLKAWKTWQWQIFGLHWCNVEVCLVFMYIYVLYLSQKETDWLGCIGGYTVILPLVYRDNDSLWWESPLTKQYNGML